MALPLRDFYPITRAAELLGCTEDDFIHWAMTGNIRLYILIEDGYCYVEPYHANNFVWHDKLFDFVNGLQELDESEKEVFLEFDESSDKFNDIVERIFDIIERRLGGISAIDNLDVRDFYQSFTYKTNLCVSDNFCVVNSVLLFSDSTKWRLKNLARYGIDASTPNLKYYASVHGFFGLDVDDFFSVWNFYPSIRPDADNRIYTPDSNFSVNLLTDKEIKFDIDSLYLSKSDFLTIKSVINNEGSDGVMPKKYRAYIMSNLHIWRTVAFGSPPETGGKLTQSKSKPERISKPMRLALQLLIGKFCGENLEPSKVANILTALAEEKGESYTFNDDTISNWLKTKS